MILFIEHAEQRYYDIQTYQHKPPKMSTLSDSFLADLQELEEEFLDSNRNGSETNLDQEPTKNNGKDFAYDLDSVSKLHRTKDFIQTMQRVDDALENQASSHDENENPDWHLISECNGLCTDIDNEIVSVHNLICDRYRSKFPELQSLVQHPIDYARIVKMIGNEMDPTLVDLGGLLPSADIMIVSMAASSTNGKPLQENVLKETIYACDRALDLDLVKKRVLEFMERRMGFIAPNLSAVVGSSVAAKLVIAVGGLSNLANMPDSNVRVIGVGRKNLARFSSANSGSRVGFLKETDIYKNTPPDFKSQAWRLLASKAILASRIDYMRGCLSGEMGRSYKNAIIKAIEKLQEPGPVRKRKALTIPDIEPKKRGGIRARKMKEKRVLTDTRKMANMRLFGVAEESSWGGGYGEGFGMLGKAGWGKLRVPVASRNKVGARKSKKLKHLGRDVVAASGVSTVSLAFTPALGIMLANPQEQGNWPSGGMESTYFSETGTFSNII